ncbi:nibrin [Anopheles maculipalpis]|uniref:nibrin n=1 Tax=Anopheles maculipalpis TaxID=1496333 RepID=UPI002159A8C3|nr:nibrin [Anopheles maculipalpis]
MWYITNNKTQHVHYLVSQSIGHTVGRTGTDLIITGDDSISRNHAILQPHNNVLHLTDTGSRYGSYVNDNIAKTVPIARDQPTALKPGDTVRFGRCGSVWTVGKVDFRCLTSTLEMDDALKVVLQKIGVELVSSYTAGLTHLIMPTITVTTKFLQCLVGQVPIVKPDFFHTIDRDCIGQGKALPAVKNFVPTCAEKFFKIEQQLFHPNPLRSNLFAGKEFIFLNTGQYNQFENIVKLAGGVCLSAQREKIAKGRFLKPNVITIRLDTDGTSQSQSQSLDKLSQYITSSGRRMVPDMEIGLALMFCSTEKYCNPEYKFAFNVEECTSSGTGGEMLAESTEEQTGSTEVKSVNVLELHTIPETEPHTEPKNGEVLTNKPTVGSRRGKTISAHPISSFLVPKDVIRPVPSVPEERRKSKRIQEATKDEKQTDDLEACSLPKRSRKEETPIESVSYSPTVESSKQVESDREGSELIVPETQPTPDSVLSQALQARGFRAVKRDAMETGCGGKKSSAKIRRAAYLHHTLDDEDMFNFDEIAPRKKARIEKGKEQSAPYATSTSQTRRNKNSNGAVEQENLFCFDEIPTALQRRGKQQTVSPDALNNNVSKSSTLSSDRTSLFRAVGVQNRINDSTAPSYREFIKPVQPSSIGWLSSTMCGLKVTDGEENSFSELKIKSEPLDEADDPYGDAMQKDCKQWIKSMANAFPVREISMKLVAHRPVDVSGQEVPCVTFDGGKNFKAFVKKRNYPQQQLVLLTKSVCVRDENQCA